MRRFMVHLVTEVEFEDGDEASDKTVQNYQKHLKDTVQNAARPGNLAPVKRAPDSADAPHDHEEAIRAADEAHEHARKRRPHGHGDM
jgi:hypothetical protein